MRKSTRFVSACVGAPVAALCFGAGTAWATPSANSSTPHVDTGGVAVSAGGHDVVQVGSSSANTSGRSVAVAFDLPGQNPSTATANGDRNFALAINGSTATANGNDNDVRAAFGSTNHVTGNNNTSYAIPGSHSTVTGDNNFAAALCGGNVNISGQGQRVTSAPCVGH